MISAPPDDPVYGALGRKATSDHHLGSCLPGDRDVDTGMRVGKIMSSQMLLISLRTEREPDAGVRRSNGVILDKLLIISEDRFPHL